MATCELCGNTYDKSFEIVMAGETHVFDSFECAIQALAPTCEHCGCRVIGHGVEADGSIYCWPIARSIRARKASGTVSEPA